MKVNTYHHMSVVTLCPNMDADVNVSISSCFVIILRISFSIQRRKRLSFIQFSIHVSHLHATTGNPRSTPLDPFVDMSVCYFAYASHRQKLYNKQTLNLHHEIKKSRYSNKIAYTRTDPACGHHDTKILCSALKKWIS